MASLQPPSPWSRFGMIVLGVGVVLILGLLWVAQHLPAPHKSAATPVASSDKKNALSPGATTGSPASTPAVVMEDTAARKAAAAKEAIAQLNKMIGAALAVLRDPANPNKQAALDALRSAIQQADPLVAIAAIRQFLASKEDAPTGLRFKVGQGGGLVEAPSLRTFLMDQLGSISTQAGTVDAAEVGRDTLSAMTSPDEWAVAMRNVAWSDPAGSKAFLAGKARELIDYAPWQQLHTGGYMEAFDVAAYSGDASLLSDLAPLAHEPSALQQAALVAMDRLSALSPDKVSSYLNSHSDLLSDLPLIRADYMGNVDLSDPAQLAQAEVYLQRPDVSLEEKTKFLARLGLPAGFVSNNLLTPPQTQTNIFARRRWPAKRRLPG